MSALMVIAVTFLVIFISIVIVSVTLLTVRDKKRHVKRKRCTAAVLCCCGAFACGAVIWFFMPFRMLSANPKNVKSIEVFSGNTGQAYTISSEAEIEQIVENLSSVKLARKKVEWRSGYSLRVTVNYKGGGEKSYIINSEKDVTMGPVICESSEGSIDFDYLYSFVR